MDRHRSSNNKMITCGGKTIVFPHDDNHHIFYVGWEKGGKERRAQEFPNCARKSHNRRRFEDLFFIFFGEEQRQMNLIFPNIIGEFDFFNYILGLLLINIL